MGMFSWECRRCERSILSHMAVEPHNRWMCSAVALLPRGSVIMGTYDGYGRIDDNLDIYNGGEPEIYHRSCWELAGKPMKFTGASKHAADQGYFYEEGKYDVLDPLETANMADDWIRERLTEVVVIRNREKALQAEAAKAEEPE